MAVFYDPPLATDNFISKVTVSANTLSVKLHILLCPGGASALNFQGYVHGEQKLFCVNAHWCRVGMIILKP